MSGSDSSMNSPAGPQQVDPTPRSEESLHAQVDAELDVPPSFRIMAAVAILTVVLVVAVIGVWQLVLVTSDAEVQRKELGPDNPELVELRARDRGRLEGYDAIDRDAGRYQIPIERAMDLLVRKPELIASRPAASGSALPSTPVAPHQAVAPAASSSAPARSGEH